MHVMLKSTPLKPVADLGPVKCGAPIWIQNGDKQLKTLQIVEEIYHIIKSKKKM